MTFREIKPPGSWILTESLSGLRQADAISMAMQRARIAGSRR